MMFHIVFWAFAVTVFATAETIWHGDPGARLRKRRRKYLKKVRNEA